MLWDEKGKDWVLFVHFLVRDSVSVAVGVLFGLWVGDSVSVAVGLSLVETEVFLVKMDLSKTMTKDSGE